MTSYSTFFEHLVRRVYIDRGLDETAARLRDVLPNVPLTVVSDKSEIPPDHMRRNTVYVTNDRGSRFGRCPGTPVHRCCNYHTVDVYVGCSLGCSYCIMRSYLNFAPLTVYLDTESVVGSIRAAALADPGRFYRVGSGEVGDSLLLDPIFRLTERIIEGVSDLPNVAFEAKTKTTFVDHLLDLPAKGEAVIGFSLNPREFVESDEGTAAAVEDRIAAAERAVDAGYRVAFHFDPIVRIENWRERYGCLVRGLTGIPDARVAWISMGTIRFTSGLRERIGARQYLLDEFVPGRDGKFRYLQRERTEMYRTLLADVREHFREAPVYLCMESEAVWERVFGTLPEDIPGLARVFDSYAVREVR